MGLVVGAYLLLNFVRILHNVFLKISLFFINFRNLCPNIIVLEFCEAGNLC